MVETLLDDMHQNMYVHDMLSENVAEQCEVPDCRNRSVFWGLQNGAKLDDGEHAVRYLARLSVEAIEDKLYPIDPDDLDEHGFLWCVTLAWLCHGRKQPRTGYNIPPITRNLPHLPPIHSHATPSLSCILVSLCGICVGMGDPSNWYNPFACARSSTTN